MRVALMMFMLSTAPAMADEWKPLSGDQITQALTARVLRYDGGETQQFNADGTTQYESPEVSNGQWRVMGSEYCSRWPPSDRWSCYGVEMEAAGLDIRFIAGDGSIATGRHMDLR